MMREAESVGPSMPLAEARAFFTPRKKMLLVTEGERFLGTLTPADLPATDDGPIGPHVNPDPPRVAPGDPVSAALDLVEDDDMTRIPVVDASDQLLGLVCFNSSHGHAGQRRVLGVEVGRWAQRLIVGLGLAVLGGRWRVGDVRVVGRDRGLAHPWGLPARAMRRTASGASRTATSSRRTWTARMNVVFAPAPTATASTAYRPPGVVAR